MIKRISILCSLFTCLACAQEIGQPLDLTVTPPKQEPKQEPATGQNAPKTDVAPAPEPSMDKQPPWIKDFLLLPEATRADYSRRFRVAEASLAQGRTLDALVISDDLEKIFDKNPGLYNLRGACYIAIKNVDDAIKNFKKSFEMNPSNQTVEFNLGESYLLKLNYPLAADIFATLLEKLGDNAPLQTVSLLKFKLYVCYVKLDMKEQAVALEDAYSMHHDTPYYFFIQAMKSFSAGNKIEGQRQVLAAMRVFKGTALFKPFYDTLADCGIVNSLEGGFSDYSTE